MKTKIICGGRSIIGEGNRKTTRHSWNADRGAIVSPARRRNSLILAALQLIARKIRAKE